MAEDIREYMRNKKWFSPKVRCCSRVATLQAVCDATTELFSLVMEAASGHGDP